jgi:hypothetical protein
MRIEYFIEGTQGPQQGAPSKSDLNRQRKQ